MSDLDDESTAPPPEAARLVPRWWSPLHWVGSTVLIPLLLSPFTPWVDRLWGPIVRRPDPSLRPSIGAAALLILTLLYQIRQVHHEHEARPQGSGATRLAEVATTAALLAAAMRFGDRDTYGIPLPYVCAAAAVGIAGVAFLHRRVQHAQYSPSPFYMTVASAGCTSRRISIPTVLGILLPTIIIALVIGVQIGEHRDDPDGPAVVSPTPVPEPLRQPPTRHEVETGDSFWNLAKAIVERELGRSATRDEIAPYWQQLKAANSGELEEPGNYNLIFPGQVFTTPEFGSAEAGDAAAG